MNDTPADIHLQEIRAAWSDAAGELSAWTMARMVNRDDRAGGYFREQSRVRVAMRAIKTITIPASATEGFVTLDRVEGHFLATRPEHVLGFHALGIDSSGKWAALDIDAHTAADSPEANERFAKAKYADIVVLGAHPLLTESDGKGGYHLRVLFRERVAGTLLFRFAAWMADGHTLGKRPESFPKQPKLRTDCPFGNWLRSPGKHPKREFWSRVWNGEEWLEGRAAVSFILALTGDDPALIPAEVVSPTVKSPPPPPSSSSSSSSRESGDRGKRMPNIEQRAVAYLRKCEPSVSGQKGHDRAFAAARAVRYGFSLSEGDTLALLQEEFNPRCQPPWSERELLHKIREADTKPFDKPRGYLLNSAAYDPVARARQWGGGFGGATATEAEQCHTPSDSPELPDDEGTDDEPVGDCEAPNNFADPIYVARLFLGQVSSKGWFTPLPRGAAPFVRTWRQEFHRFDGSRYRKVSAAEMTAELWIFLEALYLSLYLRALEKFQAEAAEAAGTDGGEDESDAPKKRPPAKEIVRKTFVGEVRAALESLTILPDDIEQPCWIGRAAAESERPDPISILPARNGLFELASGKLYPSTADFFNCNAVPYDCDPKAPPPVEWLKFLYQLWPDDAEGIACLQEWFGHLLTADTRLQKILLLIGPRRGGKGTIFRILSALLGPANVAGPTLGSLAQNFGLQPLLGKTVAMVSDARMSSRSDTATIVERLLSISGEDAQTIDRKHLSPVTVKLSTRFILATNEMPRLNDASGALAGRFVVLPLTQSFYDKEDHTLTDRLLRELPGILLWAIEGWKRLQTQKRFTAPTSGETLSRALDDLGSPIGQFLRDRCIIVGTNLSVPKADLYREWKSWCEESGHVSGADSHFARNLLAGVPGLDAARPVQGNSRTRVWVGVRLRTYLDDVAEERDEASKERHGPSKEAVHAEPPEKQAPSKPSKQKHTSYAREEHQEDREEEREEVGGAIEDLLGRPGRLGRGLADDTPGSAEFWNH